MSKERVLDQTSYWKRTLPRRTFIIRSAQIVGAGMISPLLIASSPSLLRTDQPTAETAVSPDVSKARLEAANLGEHVPLFSLMTTMQSKWGDSIFNDLPAYAVADFHRVYNDVITGKLTGDSDEVKELQTQTWGNESGRLAETAHTKAQDIPILFEQPGDALSEQDQRTLAQPQDDSLARQCILRFASSFPALVMPWDSVVILNKEISKRTGRKYTGKYNMNGMVELPSPLDTLQDFWETGFHEGNHGPEMNWRKVKQYMALPSYLSLLHTILQNADQAATEWFHRSPEDALTFRNDGIFLEPGFGLYLPPFEESLAMISSWEQALGIDVPRALQITDTMFEKTKENNLKTRYNRVLHAYGKQIGTDPSFFDTEEKTQTKNEAMQWCFNQITHYFVNAYQRFPRSLKDAPHGAAKYLKAVYEHRIATFFAHDNSSPVTIRYRLGLETDPEDFEARFLGEQTYGTEGHISRLYLLPPTPNGEYTVYYLDLPDENHQYVVSKPTETRIDTPVLSSRLGYKHVAIRLNDKEDLILKPDSSSGYVPEVKDTPISMWTLNSPPNTQIVDNDRIGYARNEWGLFQHAFWTRASTTYPYVRVFPIVDNTFNMTRTANSGQQALIFDSQLDAPDLMIVHSESNGFATLQSYNPRTGQTAENLWIEETDTPSVFRIAPGITVRLSEEQAELMRTLIQQYKKFIWHTRFSVVINPLHSFLNTLKLVLETPKPVTNPGNSLDSNFMTFPVQNIVAINKPTELVKELVSKSGWE